MRCSCRCGVVAVALAVVGVSGAASYGQISNLTQAQQYLITHGLMLSNMATSGDVFNRPTYFATGYTMENWEGQPNFDQVGDSAWS